MIAVIMAGGFGKRMGNLCENLPKPMLKVCGKPILLWQIKALKQEGIKDFIIVTGYLSDKIVNYFGNGEKFGINITYYNEKKPLGTAGALFYLDLKEDFLLCNGDLIFDFSLKHMIEFHHNNNALITLFAHPSSHPNDSVRIVTNSKNQVLKFGDNSECAEDLPNACNAGMQIVSPCALKYIGKKEVMSFDNDIVVPNLHTKKVYMYKSCEYVKDVGTIDRLSQVESDFKNGLINCKRIDCEKKAIFLDRDGTINKYKNFICKPNELELLPGAAEAIKRFNRLGYLVIIITNQPSVARGMCSLKDIEKIHNRLEMLLAQEGAYVDGIYFCPHHPDCGYAGENKDYKIKCNCRKPLPGMIFKAKNDFNIDLLQSYMVGDTIRDVETAINSGCKPIYLSSGLKEEKKPNVTSFNDLFEFSRSLQN